MFDSLNITKAYKLIDNITNNDVEVATFNAVLVKGSNINVFMNINYPNLYNQHIEAILQAYREFNAEVTALACTMGLAEADSQSELYRLSPVREDFKELATNVFNEVIESLQKVQVNPVPYTDVIRY